MASESSEILEPHTSNSSLNHSGIAEIDTSVSFESVKEAADRFGGMGFWNPISHNPSSETFNALLVLFFSTRITQIPTLEDKARKTRKEVDVMEDGYTDHDLFSLSSLNSTDVIKLLLPMGDILSEIVLLLQGVPGINATSAALWRTQILYSFIRIIVVGGIGFTFGGSIFANIRISTYKYFHQFLFRDQICCAQRNLQYEVKADYFACACQQKIDGYNGTSFYNFTALYIIP
ncbi:hypothetical protein OROGR_008126 [Orobanche gracilis]